MKVKLDEENFEEAESQAYRCWTETTIPSDIAPLLSDPLLSQLSLDSPQFYHLLEALRQFTLQPPYALPLSSTLPDMKSDTTNYIHLQKIYKAKAEEDKKIFRGLVRVPVDEGVVDLFVRNAHHLKSMRGTKWGKLDKDPAALGTSGLGVISSCSLIPFFLQLLPSMRLQILLQFTSLSQHCPRTS